jgi:protein TonB
MLKYRSFVSYFSTMLLYLLLISLYFSLQHRYVASQTSEESKMQICLSSFHAEETLPAEEETALAEPVVQEEEETSEAKEEQKVEETLLEPEKVEPIKENPAEAKQEVQPEPKKSKPAVKTKKPKSAAPQVASKGSQSSTFEKDAFLGKVREKINRHKSYPRIAQKRGMQGEVKVRFTILANGRVEDILVEGSRIFYDSAKEAVERAFPIETKNAPISLPKTITITLRYQIR